MDARVAQEGSKYGADTRPSRTPGTRANGPAVLCMAGAKEGELRRATGQGRGRCDAARSNRRRGERRCQKATIKRRLRVIWCATTAGELSPAAPRAVSRGLQPMRSGDAVAGRSAAVKVCRPPSTGSRTGRVGEASASGWRAVSTRLRRCGEGGYVGDLPLSQERRRAPPSPAVCLSAGERATQAPIVRGGEGEARAFRRPRSRGKRHVAH